MGGTWRQDGRGRVQIQQGYVPHVGEGEVFEGDEVVGVERFGHDNQE